MSAASGGGVGRLNNPGPTATIATAAAIRAAAQATFLHRIRGWSLIAAYNPGPGRGAPL